MSPLIIVLIIVLVCLIIGAIGVGVYIAVFRSKPENKGKDYDPAMIWLIMLIAFFVGLLIAAGYFLWTGRECEECEWGAKDIQALRGAQSTIDILREKANKVPRGLDYTTECEAGGDACGVRTRPKVQPVRG